jgi:hypothetical protein
VSSEPWKKAFRWRIPHLPSGDSVEFTFRAVDPSSEEYEVALYKSDRVIVEKLKREPAPKMKLDRSAFVPVFVTFGLVASVLILAATGHLDFGPRDGSRTARINEAGCNLLLISSFDRLPPSFDIWRINHRIFNAGIQKCSVQLDQITGGVTQTILPGAVLQLERFAVSRPRLTSSEISFGTADTIQKKAVEIYRE